MTSTPREIGTLIVVILKAKHLPNKRHIGKQDPYCVASMNGEKRRTKAIKRGGQHPEWDEEVRFTLLQDTDGDQPTSSGQEAPPPLPAKEADNKVLKIKGGTIMRLSCFADDPREPDLIGEANVDLTEVLTTGETDEWFTLTNKEKFSGEVYLELTFWSNEPVPAKKAAPKAPQANKQYGGPGVFTPTDDSGSSLPPPNHSGRHASSSSEYSRGRYSMDSIARPSSSMAQLDLYVPPYDQRRVSPVDHLANEFAEFGVAEPRRRESLPAPPGSYNTRPMSSASFSTVTSHSSQVYEQAPYAGTYNAYDDRPPSGLHHTGSLSSLNSSYSGYQPQYGYENPRPAEYGTSEYAPSEYQPPPPPPSRGPRYSVPSASSGFVPLQPSNGFGVIASQSTGFPASQSYANVPPSHSYSTPPYTGFPTESLQTATASSFTSSGPISSFHSQRQFTTSPTSYAYPPQPNQQYAPQQYPNPPSPPPQNNTNTIGSRPLPPQPQNYGQGQGANGIQSGYPVQPRPPGSYSPTQAHMPSNGAYAYARSRRMSLPQPPSNFQPQHHALQQTMPHSHSAVHVPPPPALPADYQQYNVPPPPPLPSQHHQPFYPGPPPQPPQLINHQDQQWQQPQQQQTADYRWS